MTAQARIEWVELGAGKLQDGLGHNIIKAFHGALTIGVDTTATAVGDRPVAPVTGFALVRHAGGSDNPIVVNAWGDDPVATAANGKAVYPGEEIPIHVAKGQKLSLIEIAP